MTLFDLAVTLGFAFTAGVFTFFAPCAYPLLPGYVSYYLGVSAAAPTPDGGTTTAGHVDQRLGSDIAQAVSVGLLVSVGFFVVYAVLAGVVVSFGTQLLAGISLLELIVGGLLIVIGGAMAAGWKPGGSMVQLPERKRSAAGFVGFGVLYAAAAAGCSAPIFIAVAVKALASNATTAVGVFGAYAAGMSVLMVGVTVLIAVGRDTLLRRVTQRMDRIYRIAGGFLVVAGLVQVYFFLFRFDGLRLLGG